MIAEKASDVIAREALEMATRNRISKFFKGLFAFEKKMR